jgi:hypothetical protein
MSKLGFCHCQCSWKNKVLQVPQVQRFSPMAPGWYVACLPDRKTAVWERARAHWDLARPTVSREPVGDRCQGSWSGRNTQSGHFTGESPNGSLGPKNRHSSTIGSRDLGSGISLGFGLPTPRLWFESLEPVTDGRDDQGQIASCGGIIANIARAEEEKYTKA